MQKLIEFYEMVSLDDAALRGSEKTAILKARLALRMFERAMESFKAISGEVPSVCRTRFPHGGVSIFRFRSDAVADNAGAASQPAQRHLLDLMAFALLEDQIGAGPGRQDIFA